MGDYLEGKSLKPVANMCECIPESRADAPLYRRHRQVMNEVSNRTRRCIGMRIPNQALARINSVVAIVSQIRDE